MSKETLWRWATGRGLLGQRLDSTLIGGNRYTSKQAAARFLASPKRERFVYRATLEAVAFVQGRSKGETEEDAS